MAKAKTNKTTTEKKKGGRQSEYPTKVQPFLEDIARYVRCGVTEGQLCDYYAVGKTQWAEYKKKHSELNDVLCKAKREHKTELINRAHQVAVGYDYEETTTTTFYALKDGVTVETGSKTVVHKKHAKADAGMLIFMLINRYYKEFARDPQLLELRRLALELQKKGNGDGNELGEI
jgi:hypothetical protein